MSTTDARGRAAPAIYSRVWLWIVAAFIVQFAVWTAWFIFAAHHRIEEIPLPTRFNESAGK